jgi:hypothetical protein
MLLRDWERRFPGRVDNIFASLSRVVPSHLMDRDRHDFASLAATGVADENGDIAFDVNPEFEAPTVAPARGPEAAADGSAPFGEVVLPATIPIARRDASA